MHSSKMDGMLAGTRPGVSMTACKVRVCGFTRVRGGNVQWVTANVSGCLLPGCCCRLLKHLNRLALLCVLFMVSVAVQRTMAQVLHCVLLSPCWWDCVREEGMDCFCRCHAKQCQLHSGVGQFICIELGHAEQLRACWIKREHSSVAQAQMHNAPLR